MGIRTVGCVVVLALSCVGCGTSSKHTDSPGAPPSADVALNLVVIGDSIPFNSSEDCGGCTGFVDRYADALTEASGRKVTTTNLSQHNGLTLPMLMDGLSGFEKQLRSADAIIVGIAHNSYALGSDAPCGTTFDEATSTLEDWSKVDRGCAEETAAENRPVFDQLFTTIASWRDGEPTILRTINKYNDWIGWEDAHLTPVQEKKTVMIHDAWNTMLCDSAEAHGFTCADVYHAFNGADGAKPSGDLLGPDYTHPSQKGNDVIADLLVGEGFAPIA